jgi:hypothetical protein
VGNSLVADTLLVSEGLGSMELVIKFHPSHPLCVPKALRATSKEGGLETGETQKKYANTVCSYFVTELQGKSKKLQM